MNLNRVIIVGRLTADPQLRTTPSGQAVATLSMATNRVWTNKQGAKQQDVQYHSIVVWGRQAEVVSQFLKKGSLAMVEGRLQTRSWQDKQGQARKTTEIVSESIQFGPRAVGGGDSGGFSKDVGGQREVQIPVIDEVKEEFPAVDIEGEEVRPEDIPF